MRFRNPPRVSLAASTGQKRGTGGPFAPGPTTVSCTGLSQRTGFVSFQSSASLAWNNEAGRLRCLAPSFRDADRGPGSRQTEAFGAVGP